MTDMQSIALGIAVAGLFIGLGVAAGKADGVPRFSRAFIWGVAFLAAVLILILIVGYGAIRDVRG